MPTLDVNLIFAIAYAFEDDFLGSFDLTGADRADQLPGGADSEVGWIGEKRSNALEQFQDAVGGAVICGHWGSPPNLLFFCRIVCPKRECEFMEDLSKLVGVVEKVAPELYKDTIQPAAQQVGKTLETGGKLVNMLLSPISGIIWSYEKITTYLEPILEEKLKSFVAEQLKSPEPHIVVPAIIALSYSYKNDELREMYANLIANSMIENNKNQAHPAFVEIIKQLDPLDAKIFKEIVTSTCVPVLKIRLASGPNQTQNLKLSLDPPGRDLFYPFALFSSCNDPNLTASSLENLQRLNLITISYGSSYTDPTVYALLENHYTIQDCKKQHEKGENYIHLSRGIIRKTAFSKDFAMICLESPNSTT